MKSFHFALVGGSIFLGDVAAFCQNQRVRAARAIKSLEAFVVDIGEGVARDVWTMDEYMTNCGVQRAEGLSMYDSSNQNQQAGSDFGLMTQTDLPAQSPVLCVPANMILSSKTLREGELNGIVESGEDFLLNMGVEVMEFPMYHLFLKILMEYEKGDESPWFPWLNSLPRRYSNGASMTRTYSYYISKNKSDNVLSSSDLFSTTILY